MWDSVRANAGLSFSVLIARQGGKNELSAQLELALLAINHTRAVHAIKAAPTMQPQGRLSLNRVLARARDLGAPATQQGYNAVRLNRARLVILSAAEGSSVVGHTADLLLECDEAQDVQSDTWSHRFRPMASSTNATTVYYGTAWNETDLLAEMAAHHQEQERRDGIRRHFAYDWQDVARHNPAYAAYVEGERQRLGDDHPLFRTQYELRPLAAGGRLLSPAALTLLTSGDHPHQRGPDNRRRPDWGYIAGLDVAAEDLGSGRDPDRTVLTIARLLPPPAGALSPEPHLELVDCLAWQGANTADLAGAVARLVHDVWRPRRLTIDATGAGEGLAAALAAHRRPAGPVVERLRITAGSKSQLGYALQAAASAGRLRLWRDDGDPDRAELLRQAAAAHARYLPNRRLQWAVPDRQGHDDHLTSLALCVHAATTAPPRTARGSLPA